MSDFFGNWKPRTLRCGAKSGGLCWLVVLEGSGVGIAPDWNLGPDQVVRTDSSNGHGPHGTSRHDRESDSPPASSSGPRGDRSFVDHEARLAGQLRMGGAGHHRVVLGSRGHELGLGVGDTLDRD